MVEFFVTHEKVKVLENGSLTKEYENEQIDFAEAVILSEQYKSDLVDFLKTLPQTDIERRLQNDVTRHNNKLKLDKVRTRLERLVTPFVVEQTEYLREKINRLSRQLVFKEIQKTHDVQGKRTGLSPVIMTNRAKIAEARNILLEGITKLRSMQSSSSIPEMQIFLAELEEKLKGVDLSPLGVELTETKLREIKASLHEEPSVMSQGVFDAKGEIYVLDTHEEKGDKGVVLTVEEDLNLRLDRARERFSPKKS